MADSELLELAAYSAPATFQAERKRIFGKGWQVVGPKAGFTETGSYSALGLGGWALIAMRGEDGDVRAFVNVCAHQKMPVIDNGRGQCAQLRCRFHGWAYNTAGHLVSAPPAVAPDEEDFEDYSLETLPCTTVGGLVFASFDEALADGPPPDQPAMDLTGLVLAGEETRSLMPNWKTVMDVISGGPASPAVSDGGHFAWLKPASFLWQEPDGVVVMQIVPRTFRKTELTVSMLAPGADAPALTARAGGWIEQIKQAAEERQQAIEAGTPADEALAARIAPLHAWIRSALAE